MFFGRKRYKNSLLPSKSYVLVGNLLAFQLNSSLLCRKAEQVIRVPGPKLVAFTPADCCHLAVEPSLFSIEF